MPEAGPVTHFSAYDAAALAVGRPRVSVVIPARNEERTVGAVVEGIRRALTAAGGGVDLVDELVVVDDGSTDATAARAAEAGATVVPAPEAGGGKGRAMALGAAATTGAIVVFLDADVENFGPHFVTGLLGPLLGDPGVVMVKAFYERPLHGETSGGGRVTELVARPLIDLLFPDLAGIRQPLAGETAVRRAELEASELDPGYGVELGLLVDVAERAGVRAVAQVDLGTRVHRNRPLAELRGHATDVLRAALSRAGARLGR
ncbi:MAG: glucosyl-3-phosphoglycerate synthase [Acidimicrobiales bacterium]